MICPNKNTDEWRQLEAEFGVGALAAWKLKSTSTVPIKMSLVETISYEVMSNVDYFKRAYPSYKSVEDMIGAFYDRVKGLDSYEVVDGFIQSPKPTYLFPPVEKVVSVATEKNRIMDSLLELKKQYGFNFDIIDNPSFTWKGAYLNENGISRVVINIARATEDTPFHEYYHPVVRNIRNTQPELYDSLSKEIAPLYPHLEAEEAITTHLGKLAATNASSPLLERFFRYLNFLFRSLFYSGARTLTSSSTMKDVMRILSYGKPSTDNDLDVAFSFLDDMRDKLSKYMDGKYFERKAEKDDKDYVKELIEANNEEQWSTDDDSIEYTSVSGKKVTRLTSLIGDKKVGVFSQKFKGYEDSFATYKAKQIWKTRGVDISTPLQRNVNGTVENVSFEQVVAELEQELSLERKYGKMVHAYLNWYLEWDKDRSKIAKDIFYKYAREYYGQDGKFENYEDLTSYSKNMEGVLAYLNLRIPLNPDVKIANPDRIAPEVVIASPTLGVGTTIDGFIQHSNGEASLVDWKTGNIMKDYTSTALMKYGNKFDITDTKLNRAKLEMAYRALLLKEKFPNMAFRNIRVVKLDKEGNARAYDVDLAPYLGMISEYYKETSPSIYENLKSQGLLEAESYGGTHLALVKVESQIEHLSYEDKKLYLQEAINDITLRYSKDDIEGNDTLKRRRAELSRALLELEKLPHVNLSEDTPDVDSFRKGMKNLGDIDNRQIQTLHKVKLEAEHEMRKEMMELDKQHKELLEEVLVDSATEKPLVRGLLKVAAAAALVTSSPYLILGIPVASYVIDKLSMSRKDAWSWMWKKSSDPARPGYYLNTTDFTENGVPLTEAQKKYRNFVTTTMASKWEEVMGRPLAGRTTAEYLGLPKSLPEDFMPRVFMDTREVRQNLGFLGNLQQLGRRHITKFFEEIEGDNTKGGAPVKFFAHTGSAIVASENHSFDVEKAFGAFMGMLLEKKYKDNVYALAEGTKNALALEKSDLGGQKYKNLTEFLDSQIYIHFLKQTKPSSLTASKVKLNINPAFAKMLGIPPGSYNISQEELLRMVKSGLSLSIMGFKLMSATFNGMLITMVNASQSTRSLVSKIMGIPPDEYEPNFQTTFFALKDVLSFWKDSLLGRTHKSKLWNLAKVSDWLPDNYDFQLGAPGNLLSSSPSLTFNSYAFMMTNFVETYGALWHLGIMLRSTKLKDKDGKTFSAWDAFNSDGTWKKGYERKEVEISKGVFKPLKELDALEWKTLKRAYEKLHGSYRQEEKVAMEATIWGQFLIQFKRYLPTYLKNLYASPYKDITVGAYRNIKRPDGTEVHRWEEELMEGRYRVLASAIMAGALPRTSKFKALDPSKQRHFSVLMNTFLWLALAWLMFMPDDEEEDTYRGWRMKRLVEDISQGTDPRDLLHGLEKPMLVLSKTSQLADAFFDSASDIISGDRTSRGKIRGGETIINWIPIASNMNQLSKMVDNAKVEEDYLFGVIPMKYFESTNR